MYHSHAYIHGALHAVETRTARRWINSHAARSRTTMGGAPLVRRNSIYDPGIFVFLIVRGTATDCSLSYTRLSADRPYRSIFAHTDTQMTFLDIFFHFCDYPRKDTILNLCILYTWEDVQILSLAFVWSLELWLFREDILLVLNLEFSVIFLV